MDCVASLPPGGDKSYIECLVIVVRYSKTPIFLPCHRDDTDMNTALLLWNRVISHTGLFRNIIVDRDPKFTSALWTNLNKLLGTKLSYSTGYHSKTDGLGEIMIQTLEGMIRRLCGMAWSLKNLIALPMIGVLLYKHWNYPRRLLSMLQQATLLKCWKNDGTVNFQLVQKKDLVYIHPTASIFRLCTDKVRHNSNQSMNDAFEYVKQKWDKSHNTTVFKVGDLIVVSTLNFNNIKGPKKLKDSFTGPFIIQALHGINAVQR
ncbi:hypothetical protein O181_062373 [Austropuccinia psidii MF-1]|uniref:Integrase catalytic domain-containing protein n=1 Tax=Austropuccinia psidii MF-1 TaxID=1389203 RepID=A0A9Q3EPL8_9BASI|nr:hypothetical protein [Austropuccinia psidii MF-1]